jgi:hypothetical protein
MKTELNKKKTSTTIGPKIPRPNSHSMYAASPVLAPWRVYVAAGWGPRVISFLLTETAVRAWNGSAKLGSFVRAPRASRSLAHRLKPSPPDSDLLSGTHVVRRFVPADRARPGAESARSLRRRPTEIRRTLRAVRTDPSRSSLPGYKWKPRPPPPLHLSPQDRAPSPVASARCAPSLLPPRVSVRRQSVLGSSANQLL